MLMRMNELRAIVEQVRDFIGEQIVRTADRSGGVRRETVLAMQAPLERLLAACTDARSAIAAWQTVSATASEVSAPLMLALLICSRSSSSHMLTLFSYVHALLICSRSSHMLTFFS